MVSHKKATRSAIGYGVAHLLLCGLVLFEFSSGEGSRYSGAMIVLIVIGPLINSLDIVRHIRNAQKSIDHQQQ